MKTQPKEVTCREPCRDRQGHAVGCCAGISPGRWLRRDVHGSRAGRQSGRPLRLLCSGSWTPRRSTSACCPMALSTANAARWRRSRCPWRCSLVVPTLGSLSMAMPTGRLSPTSAARSSIGDQLMALILTSLARIHRLAVGALLAAPAVVWLNRTLCNSSPIRFVLSMSSHLLSPTRRSLLETRRTFGCVNGVKLVAGYRTANLNSVCMRHLAWSANAVGPSQYQHLLRSAVSMTNESAAG
jgi:hypothetical protein